MACIQPVINAFLFVWLLMLTGLSIRFLWGREGQQSRAELEQLVNQVEEGQRLINTMSQDLLALSKRTLQEVDELRSTVRSLGNTLPADTRSSMHQSASSLAETVHPSLARYHDVYRRAAEGQDVIRIAKELGMGKGEVELVLALGQKQTNQRHKS